MVVISSREAKEKFGVLMDTALREPVTVTKHSRPSVVVISVERYAELETMEDQYWIAKARAGEESGYISPEDSEDLLKRMLNAKD